MTSFRLALRSAVICHRLLPMAAGFLLCAAILPTQTASAGRPRADAIVRVPEDAATIQQAINIAAEGAQVVVAPGVYHEFITLSGRNVVLRSTDPLSSATVAATIIEWPANATASLIEMTGTESEATRIEGLTLRDGLAGLGGAINGHGSHATIRHNLILGNRAYGNGGGLFDCDGAIHDNTLEDNEAMGTDQINGGGGALSHCDGRIWGNRVLNNRADYGGGITNCAGIIEGNRIEGNQAGFGGGLTNCSGVVLNNMILRNHATQTAGGAGYCSRLLNNTIYGNTSAGAVGGVHGSLLIGCLVWANQAQMAPLNTPYAGSMGNWIEGIAAEGGTLGGDPRVTSDSTGLIVPLPDSPLIDGALFQPELALDYAGTRRPLFVTAVPGNGRGYDIGAIEVPGTLAHTDAASAAPLLPGPAVVPSANPFLASTFVPTADQVFNAAQWDFFLTTPDAPFLTTITLTTSTRINLGALLLDQGLTTCGVVVRHWGSTHLASPLSASYIFTMDPPRDVIGVPEAFARITDALRWADPVGAEIIVAPGRYREALDLSGRRLLLRSIAPTSTTIRNATIIDVTTATFALPVILFDGSETSATHVAGLTLRGGHYSGVLGKGTHATLSHNLITDNAAYFWRFPGNGGGIHDVDGLIEFNEIAHNSAGSGAGLYGCDGLITHNQIHHNQASSPIGASGAGLADCQGTISFNHVHNNVAGGNSTNAAGGGLSGCNGPLLHNLIQHNRVEGASASGGGLASCAGTIQGNRIEANTVTAENSGSGAGLHACGDLINNIIAGNLLVAADSPYTHAHGAGVDGADRLLFNTIVGNRIESLTGDPDGIGGGASGVSGLVQNNIFWGNAATTDSQVSALAPTFCMIEDWPTSGVDGNSAANPLFVDAAAGDYRLRPISPAIDTALAMPEVTDDYARNPRPQTRAGQPLGYDIGAYEWFSPLTFTAAGQWPPHHGAATVLQLTAEDVAPGLLAIEIWQTDTVGVGRRILTLKYVEMLGDTLDVSVEPPPYLAGQHFTLRVLSLDAPEAWDESALFDIQPMNATQPDAWSLYR